MRWLGMMAPGSAAGDFGHSFICWRPNATVDANATESCFLRPAMSRGCAVSGCCVASARSRAASVAMRTQSSRVMLERTQALLALRGARSARLERDHMEMPMANLIVGLVLGA